jgi:hypothetical protein
MRTPIRLIVGWTILLSSPASALELRWSTDATDLSVEASVLCTLSVVPSKEGELLPAEWRLLYVVENGARPQFISETARAGVATACSVGRVPGVAGVLGNLETVGFCRGPGERADRARYIFSLL